MDNLTILDNIEKGAYQRTEDALADAITVYRSIAADLKEWEAVQARAKRLVTEIMQETGQTKAVTTSGTAQFTADSVRTSYDTKALDALSASDEVLARILAPHRKETTAKGSLTIK
jgi:hypothetical protein